MTETEQKLINAAIEIFGRYGFRRTTMGDVAKAAGLSRQTLYACYSNKEKLLAAAIQVVGQRDLAEMKECWKSATDVRAVLDIYCEKVTIKQFEMIKSMPDSEDLIAGLDGASNQALCSVLEDQVSELSKTLQVVADLSVENAHDYADFFVGASKGLKHASDNVETLKKHLRILTMATETQIKNT